MNLKKIGLAVAISAASSSAFAWDYDGDGELVLNVWNDSTNSSLTVDLDIKASEALGLGNTVFNISGLGNLGTGSLLWNVAGINTQFANYPEFTGVQESTGGYLYATANNAPALNNFNSSVFATNGASFKNLNDTAVANGALVAGADNDTYLVQNDAVNYAGDKDVFGANMFQLGGQAWWSTNAVAADGDSVYATWLGSQVNFNTFAETPVVKQSAGLWTFDSAQGTLTYAAAVPVPAAVWMFASGLLGLAGIARRNKKA